ncbi:agmatine deiminase [Limibacillus halophilus]|uniref:Putative agmatine deiminase n=1 Tax=Limibacillus halophilus TaxID=1579333 RepID=A0A839SQE9_9PROT|nr:agmatine deiminase [Limibacillus halophilus]MBB3065031.1 agmatine deiminase [Limibacillus halophilus]
MTRPSDNGYRMPAEWEPHQRCWMAWPCREELWGDGLEAARDAYAEVARAIAAFEPVTMIANPRDVAEVSLQLGPGIATFSQEHDDSWMRDNGPTFLVDSRSELAGVDWKFNGWGGKYEPHDLDDKVAEAVIRHVQAELYKAPIVLEGGSIHTDGEGTLLTTEQCLLNPNRNSGMDRKQIEEVLQGYLGVRKVVWLGQGLHNDETDGHVDNLCCFVKPGVVLLHACRDSSDPNNEVYKDARARLENATDAQGRSFEIVEIEQPRPRKGRKGDKLAASYVNFYIANEGVIVPAFDDPRDEAAFDTISKCFPDHDVVQVLAGDIVVGGGGIHCITQQQPKVD